MLSPKYQLTLILTSQLTSTISGRKQKRNRKRAEHFIVKKRQLYEFNGNNKEKSLTILRTLTSAFHLTSRCLATPFTTNCGLRSNSDTRLSNDKVIFRPDLSGNKFHIFTCQLMQRNSFVNDSLQHSQVFSTRFLSPFSSCNETFHICLHHVRHSLDL